MVWTLRQRGKGSLLSPNAAFGVSFGKFSIPKIVVLLGVFRNL